MYELTYLDHSAVNAELVMEKADVMMKTKPTLSLQYPLRYQLNYKYKYDFTLGEES